MLSHIEFTKAFQTGIDTKIAPEGTIGEGARFDVYRNNSLHSRIEALRARFPAVDRLVGAEFFGMMAREFVRSHPPRSPVLHEWGGEFPAFLTRFPPVESLPYLPDVARIEIARGQAYHAADAQVMTLEALQEIIPDIATVRLKLVPAAQMLWLAQPGYAIWVRQQPYPPQEEIKWVPEQVFVSRAGMDVITRAISAADARFLEALMAEKPCSEAISQAMAVDPSFDPMQAFLSLICDQQISASTPN